MKGTAQEIDSSTIAVRKSHRFDQNRLEGWMTSNIDGFRGPLTVEQFKGGQSNPTYKIVTPDRSYVLRRKPPGELLKGAHSVDREARVLAALELAQFPVAHVYGMCADEGVIGTAFYVMECIEGRILWDGTLPNIPRAERPAYYDEMNALIARLHGIDYASIGLADYGRAGNYVERQIGRWTKQYVSDSASAGRDPNIDRLLDWLPRRIPKGEETSIVHGDYRIDNMIFHPTEPKVMAVLDWELSTLGHPLADFAYHLMVWRMPPTLISGLAQANLSNLNIPTEIEHVAAYCRRTGRASIPDLDFYVIFNMFRFVAIVHGIKARITRGTASSPHARDLVAALPMATELAWNQTKSVG
jgi:aminoglycoside phosphotransferase (APT) family kinase protein